MPKKSSSKFKTVNIRTEIHKNIKEYCIKKGYKVQYFIEHSASKIIALENIGAVSLRD